LRIILKKSFLCYHTRVNILTRVWQQLEYHLTSLVVKKRKISFPAAVKNSIKVGPLVLLL
jgi:hypothetical protein